MAFLKNPKAFAGGVINMNFRGIESWQDGRSDLLAICDLKNLGKKRPKKRGV